MRSSKPPALATWLVRHAIPGSKDEALAGDLLERFSQGRSAAWYWRQVFVAIWAGFSKEFRIGWLAAAFTLLWISSLSLFYSRIWTSALNDVLAFSMRRPWPISLINTIVVFTVLNALPLPIALCTYLGMTRRFSLGGFSRGIFVGLFALALAIFLGLALSPKLPPPGLFTHSVAALPVFFSLSLSLWAARSNRASTGTAKIPP